ncbi:MAG: hypothetical protein AAGH41_12175 [Pseudomonadota bacterium]
MPYAQKKMEAAARDIPVVEIIGLGIAAAIGIGVAVIVDLFQHREASALYVINRAVLDVTTLLGIETVPLYGIMLLLMAVGAGTVMFFQPVTARGAFTQGFGALATLVTLAPSDLGTPLIAPMEDSLMMMEETIDFSDDGEDGGFLGGDDTLDGMLPAEGDAPAPGDGAPSESEEASLVPQIIPASLAVAAQSTRSATEYQLRIKVEFPNGLKDDVQTMVRRGRLAGKIWNKETGTTYNIFRNSGARMAYSDGELRIETVVPGADGSAELWILLEADGYGIYEGKFSARSGANRIWNVEMEPSNTPLFLLRLRHSYRF